jgi:hypothetical protein
MQFKINICIDDYIDTQCCPKCYWLAPVKADGKIFCTLFGGAVERMERVLHCKLALASEGTEGVTEDAG